MRVSDLKPYLAVLALSAAIGCAALPGILATAGPLAANALGAYAAAAADAQRQAGLPATDPEIVALRAALAALAAAEHGAEVARQPVTCAVAPAHEAAPQPPPAVDVDRLADALASVAESNRAVVEALGKVKKKAKKKAPVVEPTPPLVIPTLSASDSGVNASDAGAQETP